MNDMQPPRTASRPARTTAGADPREYLAFALGSEHYAIDIRCVQEIRGYSHVTAVASAPAQIKGITNLRGLLVPILDLRIRFGQPDPTYNEQTIVIVLTILERTIGVVVDAVSDVIAIAPDAIMPAPQLGSAQLTAHIVGVTTHDERMIIVLDVEKVFSDDDLHQLGLVAAAQAK